MPVARRRGDDTFPMNVMIGILALYSVAFGAALQVLPTDGALDGVAFPKPKELGGVVLASLAWVLVYELAIGVQIRQKSREGALEDVSKHVALRCIMNMLEQAFPFFVSLWVHALFVNPKTAATMGYAYAAACYAYCQLYCLYGAFTIVAELATVPRYQIVVYLACSTVYKLHTGSDFHAAVRSAGPAAAFVAGLALNVAWVSVFKFLSMPGVIILEKGEAFEVRWRAKQA